MSTRRLIVEVDTATVNVAEFCREHGVGRSWFYELRGRYALEGDAALEPASRAPHHVANKTPVEVENAIVAERKRLTDSGLDAGAGSIRYWLELAGVDGIPSESTIWRILVDRGFVVAEPRKAPKGSGHRFEADHANDTWQLDDTNWALADGTPVKILNVIDDHSRLLVDSRAMAHCTGAATLATLCAVAAVLGWPRRFQSDNASAFKEVLAAALAELGIGACHSSAYHPQTNGKIERFHQTLKNWLAKQPPAATLDRLQSQLDWFRHYYNHQRPHRARQRSTPAQAWTEAPKAGPDDRPLGTPTSVHTGLVDTNGTVSVTRRYAISLGADYRGQQTLTIITGLACHVFVDGRLARQLTLDPTRRHQPLYNRPGRPARDHQLLNRPGIAGGSEPTERWGRCQHRGSTRRSCGTGLSGSCSRPARRILGCR